MYKNSMFATTFIYNYFFGRYKLKTTRYFLNHKIDIYSWGSSNELYFLYDDISDFCDLKIKKKFTSKKDITLENMVLMTKVREKFINWINSLKILEPTLSLIKIEKNSHIYVLKTDGGIKVGKTRNSVVKRIKGLQTGNIKDIQILLDYHTCNHDLLEKYIHYILADYRCESKREFFECDVEYIKSIVQVSGIVLDIMKSFCHKVTKKEIITELIKQLQKIL